ncbi:MAG TPA: hypothetical protein VI423_00645 [Paenisporosarcina sp.]|nr:hypothetical protein [Paenisporosarcina sp.]
MINKIASTIEMSFDIPESEVEEARVAADDFKRVINVLDVAKKHLNIMYEPFKSAESIPPDSVYEYRGAIHRYKEQIVENFNKVKAASFLAIMRLNFFSTDTHIMELINTFRDSVTDVEKQVNILLDVLDDLKSAEFKDNVVKGVESVRQAAFEVEKLIKERIHDYLDANILANDWVSNMSVELKTQIKDRVPYITQLFLERQKALDMIGNKES